MPEKYQIVKNSEAGIMLGHFEYSIVVTEPASKPEALDYVRHKIICCFYEKEDAELFLAALSSHDENKKLKAEIVRLETEIQSPRRLVFKSFSRKNE